MSNRHPGIADPRRECDTHLAPFLRVMADWQGRFRPFSPEWQQLSRVTAELHELAFVLNDRPREGPFAAWHPDAQNDA